MQPPVKNPVIGIVGGRGTLGQIFKRAFELAGYKVVISGRKPDGKKVLSNKVLAKKTDVVIVSVFLKDTERVLREIAPLLSSRQLFCDFTSVKAKPIEIMLTSKAEVVGLHPMFGEILNLAGHNIFACPMRAKKWWPWLRDVLQSFGLQVHEIEPNKHDKLAAVHQSVPHLLLIAFANLLARRKINPVKLFQICAPSTRLTLLTTGRLLAQNPELYKDIQFQNPETKKTASELRHILFDLTESVEKRRGKQFLAELTQATKHFGDWKDFALAETNKIFSVSATEKRPTPATKKIDSKRAIALLGPATQTELAGKEFLARSKLKLTPVFFPTISEIFQAVAKGKTVAGFIPLENYAIGPVRETVKQLFFAHGKLKIIAELSRPIAHALIGQKKLPLSGVSKIFAHPQARAQCQHFLQKNFPRVEIVETAHTGESVARATEIENSLAIGPAEFAAAHGLKVLKKNIEDDPSNRTRFVVITTKNSKLKIPSQKKQAKTVLAFHFAKNKAGQLSSALTIFAEHKINLSRLESIPTEKKLGEFFFFTECEINEKNHEFQQAVRSLGKIAKVVILGSYGNV